MSVMAASYSRKMLRPSPNNSARTSLQNCRTVTFHTCNSYMPRRGLPCTPCADNADNIGARTRRAGSPSMMIWLCRILGGRYAGRALGALRRLFFTLAATSSVLVGLTDLGHAAASPCVSRAFEGASYIVCTFDLREYALRLFWKDENGVPYGGFDHLPRRIGAAPMVFAMNAGMYDESLAPVGLYVEAGKVLKRANTASGAGNFHLKPNGIFYVDGDNAGVLTTEQFLSRKPKAEFATQSGPMLVIDGRIHPKIRANSTSRKIRNGVGLRDPHTVVFAI